MKNKLVTLLGAATLSVLGLVGCLDKNNPENQSKRVPQKVDYVSKIPMNYSVPMAITSGDFDGDGNLDSVVGVSYGPSEDGRVFLLQNDGKGNFTRREIAKVPMDYQVPMAITSGDFDGDGNLDSVVGVSYGPSEDGRVFLLQNDGKGNFTRREIAKVPMDYQVPMAITSGDFDNDKDLDLMVGVSYGPLEDGRVFLLQNDGHGNFTKRQYSPSK